MVNLKKTLKQDYSRYGFSKKEKYVYKADKGLTSEVIKKISELKSEPKWMLDFRLSAYKEFLKKQMPSWGSNLSAIDFENIVYFMRTTDGLVDNWDDVPKEILDTFDKLGVPQAERKFLAGVGAQYESEMVYHKTREDLEAQGVIFTDMDTALKEHSNLVKKYFGTIVPSNDNKFASLNSAVWSGGSFVYVPKGINVKFPLQAYFRINAKNLGQFERTLIIVDEGASLHYIEGCTAPNYSTDSLHAAVVEVIALKDSHVRYTTIQNWSNNVYNLVTKRAYAYEGATVEWVDGNLGSKLTMKYPAIYLQGKGARADILSIAFAAKGQHQDAGAKVVHNHSETSSVITNKSISMEGGKTTYRGLVCVGKDLKKITSSINCDALLLDNQSASDTIPYMDVRSDDVSIGHEASVGKINEEDLFYLMSRGLSSEQALSLIVSGFFEPFTRELPFEYAVELNRLIKLEMEGSVG